MKRLFFLLFFFVLGLSAATQNEILSEINFNTNFLSQGVSNKNYQDIKDLSVTQKSSATFKNFRCPKKEEINDVNFDKNENYSIRIDNVNFQTGEYTCIYSTQNSKSFYELKKINKELLKNINTLSNADIAKLSKDFSISSSFGSYRLSGNLSSSQIQSSYNQISNVLKNYDEELSSSSIVDFKNSLDSHTNHSQTLSSVLLGLMTIDTEFFNSGVDAMGSLNFKDYKILGSNNSKMVEDISSDISSLVDGLDGKMWGYYYYLILNLNDVFSHIVTMLFGLGVVGLFGYGFFRKNIDLTSVGFNKLDSFDIKPKFVQVLTALIIFTAPIIPNSNANVDEKHLYNNRSELAMNSTLAQTGLRYIFQLGTYWANLVNDTALNSYLSYISSSYGVVNSNSVLRDFNKDTQNFLTNSMILKSQVDFFEKTCAYNYTGRLIHNNSLPLQGKNTFNVGIDFLQENELNVDYVEYNYCSKLINQIQQGSESALLSYKNLVSKSDQISSVLSNMRKNDVEELNDFLNFQVNINNNFGWLSVMTVPVISHVLETKSIFKYTVDIEDTQSKLLENVGKIKNNEQAIIETQNQMNFNSSNDNSVLKSILSVLEKGQNSLESFGKLLEGGAGWGLGKVFAYSIYYLLPGFEKIFTLIRESHFISYLIDMFSSHNPLASLLSVKGTFFGPLGMIFSQGLSTISNLFSQVANLKVGGDTTILEFLATFIVSIMFYTYIISTLAIVLVIIFLILQIIFFYFEIIIAFFISTAIMFWSLAFDQNKALSSMNVFFGKAIILAFTPISIVMSVYIYTIIKGVLYFLWSLLVQLAFFIGKKANVDFDSNTIEGSLMSTQIYTIYNLSHILFLFVSIYVSYLILFTFHNKTLSYFGSKGQASVEAFSGKLVGDLSKNVNTAV